MPGITVSIIQSIQLYIQILNLTGLCSEMRHKPWSEQNPQITVRKRHPSDVINHVLYRV